MPTIFEFFPKANLKNGVEGLNSTNHSNSPTDISGTDFADGMAVSASWGSISWSGNMKLTNGSYSVGLKCSNPGNEGGTEDVTVTVGSGNNRGSNDFTV